MRYLRGLRAALPAAMASGLLAACSVGSGNLGETLGLNVPPPDPFLIVARAPIEVPSDLHSLPRPDPGAPSRVEPNPVADARAALMGSDARVAPAPISPGEAALLREAGAPDADPNIRENITDSAPVAERKFGLDSLFGIPIIQNPALEAERLSPAAEAERLRAEGLPAPVAPPEAPPTNVFGNSQAPTTSVAPANPKRGRL